MLKVLLLITNLQASINDPLTINEIKQKNILNSKLKKYNNIYFFTLISSSIISLIISNSVSESAGLINCVIPSIIITNIFWKFILKKSYITIVKNNHQSILDIIFFIDENEKSQYLRILFELFFGCLIYRLIYGKDHKNKQIESKENFSNFLLIIILLPIIIEIFLTGFSIFFQEENKDKINNYVAHDVTLVY